MNDERLVREIWKELPKRAFVGERLVRAVGARGWERPRFARFRRFFERCGVPDPWDPSAGKVEIGLGEVGIAQRKTVAPHAAPPGAAKPAAPAGPRLPNAPAAAPRPPPDGGKPAPRIGETRKDDTATLKQKLAESEKKKVNPAHANPFKVNQPVARLPVRPDLGGEGEAKPAAGKAAAPAARPAPPRPPASPPPRPGGQPSASGGGARPGTPARPYRIPIDTQRRPALPDGPEEIEDLPPVAVRAGADRAYGGFGLGGGWDDDDLPAPTPRMVEPEPYPAPSAALVEAPPPVAAASVPSAPPAPPPAEPPQPAPAALRPPAPAPAGRSPVADPAEPPVAPPERVAPPAPPPRPPPRPPAPISSAASASAPRPAGPQPPPSRKPPGGGGLDDLFGMGSSAETRVRMPKKEEGEAQRPRRPMVTPDAELGKAGIDRRPPPARPPSVTPSGGPSRSPTPAPDDDGGE